MIYHAEMVARAARRALVVADLPFMSYQVSPRQALRSAGRILKETNCQAVKLEGGARWRATIRALVEAGIPVMGHVGLQPQVGPAARRLQGPALRRGDPRRRPRRRPMPGRSPSSWNASPASLAARITEQVPIPTIGIGAGPQCDGQVLVVHDMLGPDRAVPPQVRPPLRRARPADPRGRRGLCRRRRRGAIPRRGRELSIAEPADPEAAAPFWRPRTGGDP